MRPRFETFCGCALIAGSSISSWASLLWHGFMLELKYHSGHILAEELQALWEAPEMGPCLVLVLKVHGCEYVTLGQPLSFSKPQFPHLGNGDTRSICS